MVAVTSPGLFEGLSYTFTPCGQIRPGLRVLSQLDYGEMNKHEYQMPSSDVLGNLANLLPACAGVVGGESW